MKCSNCGNKNRDGASFCTKCGCSLGTVKSYTDNPQTAYGDEYSPDIGDNQYYDNAMAYYPQDGYQQNESPQNNNNKPSGNKWIIAVVVAVIAVAAIAVSLVFIFFNSIEDDDYSKDDVSSEQTEDAEQETTRSVLETTIPATTVPATEEKTAVVPDVVGLMTMDATDKLRDAGFEYEIILTSSDSVQADYVISQFPIAGKKVDEDEQVTIYVSDTDNAYEKLYCRASDYATLRSTASRSGKELAKIKPREEVDMVRSSGEFYYVNYKDKSGYVLKEFFSTDPDAPLNYGNGNSEPDTSNMLYCCASDYATLRSSASRSGKELAKIDSREAVRYISSSGEFYYVSYNGEKGYVLKNYFSSDPDAALNYGDD